MFKFLKSKNKCFNGWHSWDSHPWKHPWLSSRNLSAVKEFSSSFWEKEKKVLEDIDPQKLKIGFCGNIANCMYVRALPLRKAGLDVGIYMHPHDTYVMSNPVWEEFNGTLEGEELTFEKLKSETKNLPTVDNVYQFADIIDLEAQYKTIDHSFIRKEDWKDFRPFMSNIATLIELQGMDVLWGTQQVYLSYLANKPYVVSQMGGDIWFEASRGDMLGLLMRKSFQKARVFFASNPWTFAHARRFGYKHLVYLPKIIDQDVYSPGAGKSRKSWNERSKGKFYVLTSSRLDEKNKGASIGIRGFSLFSRKYPEARLVLIGWGKDKEKERRQLDELGIKDKVIFLPVSGKALLRDYLRSADVFIDQFVLGYFGSAGMEAMACGLPMIGRIEASQYEALAETGAPPVHNASYEQDVYNHLCRLYENQPHLNQSADLHREWFCKNHGSDRWLSEYQAVLAATSINNPVDFYSSPLQAKLSIEEKEYHKHCLKEAPAFPNYGW